MTDDPPPATPPSAAALEYAHPARGARPGLIIAIGVLSIVVASFSGLSSLWGTLQGFGYYMMATSAAPAMPATPAAVAPAATSPAAAAAPTTAPSGAVSMSVVATSGGTVTATATTSPAAAAAGNAVPVAVANPLGGVSLVAALLNLVTNVLSLALAAYLLVIGILTLVGSPRGGKLHWWYALLKIPLVIVTTAVTLWLWSGIMRSMNASMPAGTPMGVWGVMGVMTLMTIVPACLALVYPIGLLLVLRSKTVRAYYDQVRE